MAEAELWRAVIDQAFVDAFQPPLSLSYHESNCARVWLLFNNREFPVVCDLADQDPEAIRSRARKIDADVIFKDARAAHRAHWESKSLHPKQSRGKASARAKELREMRVPKPLRGRVKLDAIGIPA